MPSPDPVMLQRLTPKQQEIFHCVVEGLTDSEIGARLNMSPGTVKVHLRSTYIKCGVKRRTQLVARLYGLAKCST